MVNTAVHRRDQVLEAAKRLFAERGYHGTSVRDIAEALNIKGGSLYAHVESKDEILWEIVLAAAERFFGAVTPIAESDLVPVEKLRRAINAHVQVITSDLPAATVYSTEWRNLPAPRRGEFAARRDEYERMFRRMVLDCMHDGIFADVDEKFATLLILSSLNWIYQWYKPGGTMTPEEIARRLTDMLFNGLKRVSA